jgi:hypothetical protein
MKGTLFSADFIKDSNENLRLLELNTDTVILDQEFINVDYNSFLTVLSENNIDTVEIIYKPAIHLSMVNHLVSFINENASFITTINLYDENINSIYPVHLVDEPHKFILRLCYDESAIFDSVYAKNRLNLYNIYTDNNLNDYTVGYYHSSVAGIKNTLVKELNPYNIPDATIKDINENFNPIDFFKIGSQIDGESIDSRWDSFIYENESGDKLIEQYHFHPSSLDENNHLTSLRYFGIVYGNDLNVIDLHSYKMSSIFPLPTAIENEIDLTKYTNKIKDHHYYEFTTNFIKNDSGGILSTHTVLRGDGVTWSPISEFIIGDTVSSYYIEGSPQTEVNLDTLSWSSNGNTLPDGSYLTSSEVVFKEVKMLKYGGMMELKIDGDSFYSGTNKQYLTYDSAQNKTLYKYIIKINPNTDFLYDLQGGLIDIQEANFFITTDTTLEFIELDVEQSDTYIIGGSTPFNTVVSHNSPCFVAGTKILMGDGSYKNIEDIIAGDFISSFNLATNEIKVNRVLKTFSRNVNQIVKYTLENGEIIEATLDHPIYVIHKGWSSYLNELSNSMYKLKDPVKEIKIGDKIKTHGGFSVLQEIELINSKHKVYNLSEIDREHNYYANDVLVHNRFCFAKGTKIATPYGDKNIEDIKLGDLVFSYNESLNKIEERKVINTNSPIHDDLVKYTYSNNVEIISTHDHPFYVNGLKLVSYKPDLTNQRYNIDRTVCQIEVGDKLMLFNGLEVLLDSIQELIKIPTETFIITVEDNHNFYANGILVHNK